MTFIRKTEKYDSDEGMHAAPVTPTPKGKGKVQNFRSRSTTPQYNISWPPSDDDMALQEG